MTDLEEVPTPRPKRRTYNYKLIQEARDAHAETSRALYDLHERYAEVCAELEESRRANANQRETVRVALDAVPTTTAEHPAATMLDYVRGDEHFEAVPDVTAAYQGRRPDQVVGSQQAVAVCLVAGSAIVAWELLAHLFAAVTR